MRRKFRDIPTVPKSEKPTQTDVTGMLERLPSMDAEALESLRGNAERLEIVGTPAQKTGAALLLPEIVKELAKRRPAKRVPKAKSLA